jgi:uncharacterized protein
MSRLPPHLLALEDALLALDGDGDSEPMLLSELDGFFAGLHVCPDLILPGEWLNCVWGGDQPIFDDIADAQRLMDMVMRHYNAVATDLQRGRYRPLYDVDQRHNEVLWELWIDGFESAMALRPDSWLAIAKDGDEDVAAAMVGMIVLADLARGESDLPKDEADELTNDAPDMIPSWVAELHRWRREQVGSFGLPPGNVPARSTKVGRNDPCPCGSGKKYKKCCGLN